MAWVGLVHFAHRYYLYTFTSLFLSQILLFRLVMVFSSKPKPNTKMGLDDHLFDYVLRAHRSEMGRGGHFLVKNKFVLKCFLGNFKCF